MPVVTRMVMPTVEHGNNRKGSRIRSRSRGCRGPIRCTGQPIVTKSTILSTRFQGLLMQGQGFVKKPLPEALGEPFSGRNKALDALAAYTNSHKYSLSPFARNGLTEAARCG